MRQGPGASSAAQALSRPPGPEPFGDRPLLRWALGVSVFGPYFALGRDLATFALCEVPMTGLPLLRGAATPQRLVLHTWGPEPCQGPANFAPGTLSPCVWPLLCARPRPCHVDLGAVSVASSPLLCAGPPLLASPVTRARSLARPIPRARSLDLALRGRDLPSYDGRVISMHMRPFGLRGQTCPKALSACHAGCRPAPTDIHPMSAASRDGDYVDPHTSEESPRIMARRLGRRARRPAPP